MAFLNIDPATRPAMRNAATLGGRACYMIAAFSTVSFLFETGIRDMNWPQIIGQIAVAILYPLFFGIAGYRLRGGRGLVWGIFAIVVLGLTAAYSLQTVSFEDISLYQGLRIIVFGALLIALLWGVRGAWALRRMDKYEASVFE